MKIIKIGLVSILLVGCGINSKHSKKEKYPLHEDIKVTYFYVGEKASANNDYIPNEESSWDNIWLWDFGGVDKLEDRNKTYSYFPSFYPLENPFYFALPYNDLGEDGKPKETQKQIPWYQPTNTTILKNRWIKIIKGDKVAYAQWEDCGPYEYDDFEYVFGDASPKNSFNGAGLDVSPAVKMYLGLRDSDRVSWQFVDEKDVPNGPWKDIVTTSSAKWIEFEKIDTNTTWYWQLNGDLNMSVDAKVYDIDLFDTSKETISKLHQQNKIVICYFSAGSYENWRSDKDKFKESDLGNSLDEWEGERWLDIRSDNVKKIMKERLDLAKSKKCDGVEMDNVDGAANNTGFDFDFDDQIEYNRFLAIEGKKRGLLVGLKNDLEQVDELVDYFDFSVNEECNEYNECDLLEPFIKQNKPVFNAEYNKKYYDNFDELCQTSKTHKLQTLFLPKELNGSWVKSCNY